MTGTDGRSRPAAGSEAQLRRELTELVDQVGILGLREQGLHEDFIDGRIDPLLRDIGLDSLTEMELCIAIENTWGISIAPIEIQKMTSLEDLLRRLRAS